MTERISRIRCVGCGQFISYADMLEGFAHFHFEPSSHFGPEVSEWTCAECRFGDGEKQQD